MLGLSLRNIAVVAGLVWSVLVFQGCTAPTGGENNPLLVVEPSILDFGNDRNSVNLVIRNGGSGILHWIIQAPAEGWITLSQREGIITQTATVEVRIDREKAPLGAQEVKLTVVADPGGTQEVVLKANISRPGKLSLSESQLDFGESEGAHQLTLRNEGGESLNWSATPAQPWISLSPTTGTLGAGSSQEVTFTINRDGQPAGTILGAVTFSWGSGGVVSVRVSAEVAPQPVLGVAPLLLDFGIDKTSLSLIISNTGNGILHWTIQTPSEGWITLSQREGNTTTQPATIDVRIDRDKAPNGQQEVRLVVTAQGAQQEVILKADIRRPAKLSLLNSQLDFGETALTQQLTLRNDGGESLDWSAKAGQSWIALDPASGTLAPGAQQTVTITVDRSGQPVGTLQGSVNFSSDGGPADASILAKVPPRPVLSASPSELDFGLSQTRLSLEVRNIGGGSLDWTLETSDAWITPSATTGALTSGESGRVFIDVSREALEVGSHEGHLLFRWGAGTLDVKVLLRVQAKPKLSLPLDTIDLGTDSSAVFSISNTGTGALTWKIIEIADWLELDRYEGTTTNLADPVKIHIKRDGLPASSYETTVVIQSDGGDGTLVVKVSVSLPEVQLISGPREGEEIDTDPIDFRFIGVNAYGKTEFSTRLNEGNWGNWSSANEVSFSNLEESSLAGPYVFQVRVRADAGQSEAPLERRFTVNTIKGPALRFSPKALVARTGQDIQIDVVAEEVGDILGAHIVIGFDTDLLEFQRVEVLRDEDFLSRYEGRIISPEAQADKAAGLLDLSIAIAGGKQTATTATGPVARLYFRAQKAGVAKVSLKPASKLRDLNNQDIEIEVREVGVAIE